MMIKHIALGLLISAASINVMAGNTYTVSKGDTLFKIATRYHTTVDGLRSYNNLRSREIQVGQTIRIPSKNSPMPVAASKTVRQQNNVAPNNVVAGNVHVVRRGETLSTIATSYRLTLGTLARYNNLSLRKPIQAGQKIRIPSGVIQQGSSGSVQVAQAKTYTPKKAVIASAAPRNVKLESNSALVIDAETGKTLYAKNADQVRPIASITKLMTAMVTLDANMAMDETLSIGDGDVDYLKHTSSRLPVGTKLSRYEMLRLALMSSENRAASSLSRHYPGGRTAFIQAMNEKAKALGMENTRFLDPTGLTPKNVSTAQDLAKMVEAASHYNLIHQFTTTEGRQVAVRPRSAPLQYLNSNLLVRKGQWNIEVSKTGYINEAGRCLVMKAAVGHRPAVMVLLDSNGKYSPVGDATRIKNWIESGAAGVTLASL
jgi:D-alanyl-D-alanine endopeptidase (penicillin-binding protein 7)